MTLSSRFPYATYAAKTGRLLFVYAGGRQRYAGRDWQAQLRRKALRVVAGGRR